MPAATPQVESEKTGRARGGDWRSAESIHIERGPSMSSLMPQGSLANTMDQISGKEVHHTTKMDVVLIVGV